MSEFREQLTTWLTDNIKACDTVLKKYGKYPPLTDTSAANAWFTQCAFVELLERIEKGEFDVA